MILDHLSLAQGIAGFVGLLLVLGVFLGLADG